METPKFGVASIFNVQLYLIEKASTQSGSNTIFDCVRPAMSTRVFLNKSSIIKWMPRLVLESPWISKVPFSPQLTLLFPKNSILQK